MRSRSASWSSLGLAGLGLLAVALGCPAKRGRVPGSALVVSTPEQDQDADVYVDGNYVGQVRELHNTTTGPIRLAPGLHRVEVRKPGRFPVQRTVRVDKPPAPETTVEAELLEDPR
jgi:hypothetical protein